MTRLLTVLLLAASLVPIGRADAADPLKIITTIPDLADMTRQIGGEYALVSPRTWSMSCTYSKRKPGENRRLTRASR